MGLNIFASAFRRRQEAPSQRMGARKRSQATKQRILAEAAENKARGVIPIGKFVSDTEVDAWHSHGTTGHSIVDEQEQGDALDKSDVDLFLSGEMVLMVDSSNVEWMKYRPDEQILEVGYKPKKDWPRSSYGYHPVSREKALSAATASSKGTFIWNEIRVRGTKFSHQCAYWRLS